jgi:hypothetical protein
MQMIGIMAAGLRTTDGALPAIGGTAAPGAQERLPGCSRAGRRADSLPGRLLGHERRPFRIARRVKRAPTTKMAVAR